MVNQQYWLLQLSYSSRKIFALPIMGKLFVIRNQNQFRPIDDG